MRRLRIAHLPLARLSRHASSSAPLRELHSFYIDGEWVQPVQGLGSTIDVVNPATEAPFASLAMGSAADVDVAVAAARCAFETWSLTSRDERLALLERLGEVYRARQPEIAAAISEEMGAPIKMAKQQQSAAGLGHIKDVIRTLRAFSFEAPLRADTPTEQLVHMPIGVCGLITPWNWPLNQVALKVVPALAAGCAVVLKPSEIAPLSSLLFAECVHEAGFPPGAFNLVNGDGASVGQRLASHPDVEMVSFTGSTRAGRAVSVAAAEGVKRVVLELGGKGPNLVFADCGDVAAAVRRGARHCFHNSGQSCNAPTRMLVERAVYDEAVAVAAEAAAAQRVGDPARDGGHIGPLASGVQWERVQAYIEGGVGSGARLVAGGPGRPDGLATGYFARPTVFADVAPSAPIFTDEIFGPVLSMAPFDSEAEAVALANDSAYGLTSYVQTACPARARRVSRALRAGMVSLNGAARAPGSPFGGVKQSGNGREGGEMGMREYLEVKAVSGWPVGEGDVY